MKLWQKLAKRTSEALVKNRSEEMSKYSEILKHVESVLMRAADSGKCQYAFLAIKRAGPFSNEENNGFQIMTSEEDCIEFPSVTILKALIEGQGISVDLQKKGRNFIMTCSWG